MGGVSARFTNPSQKWCACGWVSTSCREVPSGGINRFRPRLWSPIHQKGVCRSTGSYNPGRRWPHEPHPMRNQPVRLGFPHRTGRYGAGVSPFSSPVCWSCRCREGFMIRGWYIILPGWFRLLRTPGCGFHSVRGGIDPGDHCFCSRFVGVVYAWNDF